MKEEKFSLFGLASFLYAIFLTFCLYKNAHGVTFPFFVIGTLYYFYYCMKKCDVSIKKDDFFYIISTILLGTSVFLTNDVRIINITKIGIILLLSSFLLHHFYDDSKWNFIKYLQSLLEFVAFSLGCLFTPVTDFLSFAQNKEKIEYDQAGKAISQKESHAKYILLGIAIAIPLLVIIVFMLSRADVVFYTMCEDFFKIIKLQTILRIVLMIIVSYFIFYSIFYSLIKKEIKEECTECQTKEPILAITFTSVISVIYIIFSGIQILYLFIGNRKLPDGYTYAQYARQGFYELLFVCIMNVVIVLICVTLFKENTVLKVILCIICTCTYIMIASSAYRMYLYVNAYYFTFLRLMVFFFLLVLSILMTGIMITIFNSKFPLFHYCMFVITIATICLAYSHPDYLIAKYNLAHINNSTPIESVMEDGKLENHFTYRDVSYLTNLCDDAAPVLNDKENFQKLYHISSGTMREYYVNSNDNHKIKTSFRMFNISSYFANKSFQTLLSSHVF